MSSQETNPRDLTFNNDGTKMFMAGVTGDDMLNTLSVGYDLSSTVTYVQSVSVKSNPSALDSMMTVQRCLLMDMIKIEFPTII